MERSIKVHQALFGYDAGHHLLCESTTLSTEAKHFLSIASDLSGSAPSFGFIQTYTGMPVPGTDYYAVFCTWPASEMPRPGCVWSHVLLIELADLAEIRDLSVLRRMLRRPITSMPNWLATYRQPLMVPFDTPQVLAVSAVQKLHTVITAVYGNPTKPIVILTDESHEFEDLMFALWSQQWPRLRRNFHFSTGSFADRSRAGRVFDIQISPESNRRAWQQHDYLFVLSKSTALPVHQSINERGIDCAVRDILEPDVNGFRSFLRNYGSDIASPRKAFGSLAILFANTKCEIRSWTENLRLVAKSFPSPLDAVRLKQWLAFPVEWLDKPDPNVVLETATFLLTNKDAQPFEQVSASVTGTVPHLWITRRTEVLKLVSRLVRRTETKAAYAFVSAVAKVVRVNELEEIWAESPQLVSLFLNFCPSLAANDAVWQLPQTAQWQIFEVLHRSNLSTSEWAQIVGAMFRAGTNVGVRDAVTKAGVFALEAVLNCWLSFAKCDGLPNETWREALSKNATTRFNAPEELEPVSVAFCVWLMPYAEARAIDVENRRIYTLARFPIDMLPESLRVPTAFFLTLVGLRANGKHGLELLSKGFFVAYQTLEVSPSPPEPWFLLAPILPDVKPWDTWDRCVILIRGLSQWIESNPQEGSEFIAKHLRTHPHIIERVVNPPKDDFLD